MVGSDAKVGVDMDVVGEAGLGTVTVVARIVSMSTKIKPRDLIAKDE